MITITYRWSFNEKVRVIEIDRPGLIIGLSTNPVGNVYKVAYWNDNTRHEVSMYESELEDFKEG